MRSPPELARQPLRRMLAGLLALLSGLMLYACAAAPVQRVVIDEPRVGPMAPFTPGRPVLALVLSGGSARGFAHIGVIKVLEEEGITPDLVVGSSVGSIVAAAYASGMDIRAMLATAREVHNTPLADYTIPNLGLPFLHGELGIVRGQLLQDYVNRLVNRRAIEALPRRLAVVATDLQAGKPIVFTHGDTGLAVRASCAVPGVFVPPSIGGRLYVDGQVSSPVPVAAARALGADIVIAVDTTFPPELARISTTVDVLFQTITIATQRIKDYELGMATLVIRPELQHSGQIGFAEQEWIIAEGERAARAALPEILRVLGRREVQP